MVTGKSLPALILSISLTHSTLVVGQAPANGGQLPGVSIVLPTRGYRSCSASNWRSILSLSYGASARAWPMNIAYHNAQSVQHGIPLLTNVNQHQQHCPQYTCKCTLRQMQRMHNTHTHSPDPAAPPPSSSSPYRGPGGVHLCHGGQGRCCACCAAATHARGAQQARVLRV